MGVLAGESKSPPPPLFLPGGTLQISFSCSPILQLNAHDHQAQVSACMYYLAQGGGALLHASLGEPSGLPIARGVKQ